MSHTIAPLDTSTRRYRADLHCHSRASSAPVIPALGLIDMPECYTPPEKLHEQAMARGMDFVTITDHDQISGVMELVDRGFENVITGEEVTVFFPEDRCKLHVLVWTLTPDQHEQLAKLDLREDVYEFAHWLHDQKLPHAFAHPLYIQNGKLKRWHLERCALLFKGWETLNGAHSGGHRTVVERYIASLTPERIEALAIEHSIRPLWPRPWHKAVTAGSDDHALMNVGQTHTIIPSKDALDATQFIGRVMEGRATVGGQAGHSALLAHQLSTVGINYYADQLNADASPRARYIAAKLGRFAGVAMPKPSKVALVGDTIARKVFRRKKKSLPITKALSEALGPVLEKYPDLRAKLDPAEWATGAAMADHDRMADFAYDLTSALSSAMSSGAVRSIRSRDKVGIVDHLISYAVVHTAQLPYLFSMFHQNKERNMLDSLEHEAALFGSGVSVLKRPMKLSLFTDTLGDVNGVCRFIEDTAQHAHRTGRDLQVITCTSNTTPDRPNIHNFAPVFATRVPKYPELEIVLPPLMRMLRHVDQHQPDVIHIATPGPVGVIGYIAARMLRVPVLGVYHTDFPAYINHLFGDHTLTAATESYMRTFYAPFTRIFTRSESYVESLSKLGMQRDKIASLTPGVETAQFSPSFKDDSIWTELARTTSETLARPSVKCLYVGRVSVEKNMPMLVSVWKAVMRRCASEGLSADLVVVGDGPYRAEMERQLTGRNAHFIGYRKGRELSTIYASSDLFLFPSTTDTLGQVVLEAQSSGIPVMVSDEGGPKEVVAHDRTGTVIPVDHQDEWIERLVGLIRDGSQRRAMGAKASEHVKQFDLKIAFEDFWSAHTSAWHDHLGTIGIAETEDVPSTSNAQT